MTETPADGNGKEIREEEVEERGDSGGAQPVGEVWSLAFHFVHNPPRRSSTADHETPDLPTSPNPTQPA